MKVAVVGTGYVGLVTGVVLASLGNEVVCVDNDLAKVEKLKAGIPTIYEPGIEELLQRTARENFLRFTNSISEATRSSEVVFIAVGTPPSDDGTPDLTAVRAVAREIGKAIKAYTVVVNKSTVPVGAGDLVGQIIAEQGVDPALFDVVSNPEFLREGSAIRDTLEPDRIVIGAKKPEAAAKLVELYAPLDRPTLITDLNSAELIKYASNSFLAMKISYINAISRLCEACDAKVSEVAQGMGADKRIGADFLQAGLGWGGSCFPKDVQGLIKTAEKLHYDFRLLKEVVNINDDQTLHFVHRLRTRLGGFAGKRIGLMGLSFKPNTDDIRDAKSLVIIEQIIKDGGHVSAYDPISMSHVEKIYPEVRYASNVFEVAENADAIILVTEWNEFKQLDLARLASVMRQKILFDGRRIYPPAAAERAGLELHSIGE